MAKMVRIVTRDPQSKEKGSINAYVVEAQNHLLQTRQFAWDGRDWFYQPDTRSPFQKVNPIDLPKNAVQIMAAYTGKTEAFLRGEDENLNLRYRCPECGHCWEEQWPSACDSECPKCDTKNITSLQYKSPNEGWTDEENAEWVKEGGTVEN